MLHELVVPEVTSETTAPGTRAIVTNKRAREK